MDGAASSFFQKNLANFSSGLVVFLIATPLCLGIALASNAPLSAGLISGAVGALVVGFLSHSKFGISSPAAGLIVIVVDGISRLETWERFLAAVVIAGVLQLLFGIFRAGKLKKYFPKPVIRGLLAGIGIIVILKQFPLFFGLRSFSSGWMQNIHLGTLIITIISLVVLLVWEMPKMKKFSWMKILQGPLVVVVIAAIVARLFVPLQPEHFVEMPTLKGLSSLNQFFVCPDFSWWNQIAFFQTAILIAVIASLETLLCLEAVDDMDPQRNQTPANRELIAQGVGNLVCGAIGGLPVVQEIVRSSANIQSGATGRVSNWFHGFLLVLTVLLFSSALKSIPLAALAMILVFIGFRLVNIKATKELIESSRINGIIFIVTTLGIVFLNLLIGVVIGMILSIAINCCQKRV